MQKNLQNRWEEYCGMSVKRAQRVLKKNNVKYKGIIDHIAKLQDAVDDIVHNEIKTLTTKQIHVLKQYIILCEKKENFEKTAIYSQGMCDCFDIIEKFR